MLNGYVGLKKSFDEFQFKLCAICKENVIDFFYFNSVKYLYKQ